jgi:hypothetical protein
MKKGIEMKTENQMGISCKKTFFLLWILCIAGACLAIPYLQGMGILPAHVSLMNVYLFTASQSAIVFGIVCFLSYLIVPKTDLHPFNKGPLFSRTICLPLLAGALVGFSLFVFDKYVFRNSVFFDVHPPLWTGFLASVYGGINEEVIMRLFFFSLFCFLVSKCLKITKSNRLPLLWSVNILVALLFGLGHVPAALNLGPLSSFELFRILFLNGIAGVVFGWLYWSRGFWAAVAAHYVADLVIHVIMI